MTKNEIFEIIGNQNITNIGIDSIFNRIHGTRRYDDSYPREDFMNLKLFKNVRDDVDMKIHLDVSDSFPSYARLRLVA